jgi:hypothetical protein
MYLFPKNLKIGDSGVSTISCDYLKGLLTERDVFVAATLNVVKKLRLTKEPDGFRQDVFTVVKNLTGKEYLQKE